MKPQFIKYFKNLFNLLLACVVITLTQSGMADIDEEAAGAARKKVISKMVERRQFLDTKFYLQKGIISTMIAKLMSVEGSANGLNAPSIEMLVGPYGSGKTTAIQNVVDEVNIPLDRVHFLERDSDNVAIRFGPIFRAPLPSDGTNLLAVAIIDEFLNLLSWKSLQGLGPERPLTQHEPRSQAEIAQAFWKTEKGRRLKMWTEMHDILGNGKLRIDAKFLERRGVSTNPVQSVYDKLSVYKEIDDIFKEHERTLDEANLGKLETLKSAMQDAKAKVDSAGSTYHRASAAYQDFQMKIGRTVNPSGSEQSKLERLDEERQAAYGAQSRANETYNEAQNKFHQHNNDIDHSRSYIKQAKQERTKALEELREAVEVLRNYHPRYIESMFDRRGISTFDVTKAFSAKPGKYMTEMEDAGLIMPESLLIDRRNIMFYFIGNPENILDEIKGKFLGAETKDPDTYRDIIRTTQSLNLQVQTEIMDKLGLNMDIIMADPEVPEFLKDSMKATINQIQSRLQISGVKFQLPPGNDEYMTMLKIWLDFLLEDIHEMGRDYRALEFDYAEGTMDILFDTIIDALGAVRQSYSNFNDLRGEMASVIHTGIFTIQSMDDIKIGRHKKDVQRIVWEALDPGNGTLELKASFRNGDDKPVLEDTFVIEKPGKSWDEQSTVTAKPSQEQIALHQAAHLVAGMHYFGSTYDMTLDFSSDDISKKIWASDHFDTQIVIAQIATLMAGPLIENLTTSENRYLPESRLSIADGRNISVLVDQLLTQTIAASSRVQTTIGATGEAKIDPMGILAERLGINPLELRSDGDQRMLIKKAIIREAAGLIKQNNGLILTIAKYLEDKEVITHEEILALMRKPSTWRDGRDGAFHSFTRKEKRKLSQAEQGSIMKAESILCPAQFTPEGERASGVGINATDAASLRAEMGRAIEEMGGLFEDVMKLFE